ncbi:MAG: EamA family transporter [Alphaproteobacteria bacterium]|nr:EamA family transporter [Alphaproteobacteria bacterium]
MRGIGFAAAILASILFGVGGTFAQFLFQHRGVNIDWLVIMRLLFSGPALLLISAIGGKRIFDVWRTDAVPLVIFGLLGMMPVQYTYMAAINASNTATATILQFTAPAMVALWLALAGRKRPGGREMAAIGLAMLGTFFLVTHGKLGALSISVLALFWGLASAAAAAFNSIQPSNILKKHGAALVAGWGMVIGGVELSLFHAPWKIEGQWDATASVFFAFILVMGTLVAFYLFNKALRLIGAQKTILLTCAEPLSAAVLAVWWLGVSFGPMDWLGSALILVTIVLLAKGETEEELAEKTT